MKKDEFRKLSEEVLATLYQQHKTIEQMLSVLEYFIRSYNAYDEKREERRDEKRDERED